MKILKGIKSEHIVAIDIETTRLKEHYEDLSDGYKSSWEYKNKQNGEIPDQLELAELWEKTSALYAEFSKICAVSLSFMHEGKLHCREIFGSNEKALLESLSLILNNIYVKANREKVTYRLVGHASKYFDYPFMGKRFIINGLDLPELIDTTNAKPWEQTNMCTNELWKLGGTGAGSSLQALCNVLDVPISKVDLVGDEVGKAYFKGEYARIGRYCSYDTVATFNVVRRFKKEPIFDFEDVVYKTVFVDEGVVTEEKQEIPLLEKLYKNNYLSDEIKVELTDKMSKQKLTKKDRENIRKILCAAYIRTTHMASDDKTTVERKENEIEEFLKNI